MTQKKVRKFFLDTEFIEDGKTIDLLSIGIVADTGEEFYAINKECKLNLASDWVRKNVIAHIEPYSAQVSEEMEPLMNYHNDLWMSRERIKLLLERWVMNRCGYMYEFKPQFWAYYAAYDWVALCQLFGTMLSLPSEFPKYCMDIKQLGVEVGDYTIARPPKPEDEHNALADARWNRDYYKLLRKIEQERFEAKVARKTLRSVS